MQLPHSFNSQSQTLTETGSKPKETINTPAKCKPGAQPSRQDTTPQSILYLWSLRW